MEEHPIRYELHDGAALITLNRPQRLNSFNAAMHEALQAAIARAAGEARALLITGAGRGFCAGQDLSDRAVAAEGAAPDLARSVELFYKPLVLALRNLPLPVVAAVNGVAAGAGANFALAADIVLAARSAFFMQPFCKLGLIPDTGGSYFLPRLVGHARALGLALTGEKLSAETAAQWGLIWKCVDDADLLPAARKLTAELAAGPTLGYACTKRAINASYYHTLAEQLNLERDYMGELGRTDDYREGVAAFLDKRAPHFRGR
ncbi:MAG: 2-(1,2-epoxy-1,2-dihydrophenyl)acetyl-CoA isomerase PaaG [Rhodocyclaceae bacterium]|nr:2-(1,2-epoxy-1,2-dihydrophenyl)acetyl-CoA isomerase [Rhodocyclaceae bacterium]MBX3666902.1 2-(1,2-epoxy-1,2-dihydrophenyl)acetyl-CoA isomerase PaaG [Rhodocyclaceae bacterium]